jgi:ubiquinone/menaquinone biosynthesis C-methylase UbiE
MTDSRRISTPIEAYQAYMVPVEFAPWSKELLDRIAPRPGEDVLDVACGTGIVARGVAPLVDPGGTVTGLDVNPAMLQMARTLPVPEGVPVTWEQGRAESLPFEDASFDVVLCQQGIQFFADRAGAVREMRRVLRPGGRVGASIWRSPEHQSVKGALLRALQEMFGPDAAVAYSFGDANAVRQLFVDAGFDDGRVEAVRRQMREPSADRMVRMVVMGASAAVPALARLDDTAREETIRAVRERIEDDIRRVRVADGISYAMEAHILIAGA